MKIITTTRRRRKRSSPKEFRLLGNSRARKPTRLLESFPKPNLIQTVEMTSDEVTALCPVTGQPDQYTIRIVYLPDQFCIESKSLKLKLQSLRSEGIFCEGLSTLLVQHIIDSIDPLEVVVHVIQKPRGGVSITSTSGFIRVPSSSGIYKLKNTITKKIYVGSAINLRRRWYDHQHALNKGKHANIFLQNSWDRYGPTAFSFEILEDVEDSNHLIDREEFWIGKLKSYLRTIGYNICRYPSDGTRGIRWKHSEETKRKISKAQTGKKTGPRSLAARERMRQAQLKRNYKRTEESKRLQSIRQTGKIRGPMSEETKQKISIANKGKTKGVPKSPEHREKIRNGLLDKPKNPEHAEKCRENGRKARMS